MVADHQSGRHQGGIRQASTLPGCVVAVAIANFKTFQNKQKRPPNRRPLLPSQKAPLSDALSAYWGHPQSYQMWVQYAQVSALPWPIIAVRSSASSETSRVSMSSSVSVRSATFLSMEPSLTPMVPLRNSIVKRDCLTSPIE
jgi:hypothetical protein